MTTRADILNEMARDARQRYAAAQIVGALRDGSLRRTRAERLDVLMVRMRAHVRAGRMQAARACRRMVERLLDEMEAYE